jgi:hypothetical protein
MADRKTSQLPAATPANLHDDALLSVVDLLEASAADRNVKATISLAAAAFLARAPNGTAALPGVAFASDPDTGVYRAAANEVGVAAGGVMAAKVTGTQVQMLTGSAAAPSAAFIADVDTGLFRVGADILGFATGGAERARVSSAGTNVTTELMVGGVKVADYGSNANGAYLKLYNGVMVCWHRQASAIATNVNVTGAYWRTNTVNLTFPVEFVGVPTVVGTTHNGAVDAIATNAYQVTTTTVSLVGWGVNAAQTMTIGYVAIGRWL